MTKPKINWKKEMMSWIKSIVVSLIIVMIIGVFAFQPMKVLGHSMDPSLHDTERIYVSKLPHTLSNTPDYGDIVIIDSRVQRSRTWMDALRESPPFNLFMGDDHHIWIKRVIGKAGDEIRIIDNQVYRNGEALVEPYIKEKMRGTLDKVWHVPEGHIFVLGDNRNNSSDSRIIGFIPLDHVLGKKL